MKSKGGLGEHCTRLGAGPAVRELAAPAATRLTSLLTLVPKDLIPFWIQVLGMNSVDIHIGINTHTQKELLRHAVTYSHFLDSNTKSKC